MSHSDYKFKILNEKGKKICFDHKSQTEYFLIKDEISEIEVYATNFTERYLTLHFQVRLLLGKRGHFQVQFLLGKRRHFQVERRLSKLNLTVFSNL